MTIAMIIPDDNLTGITPGVKHPPEICVDYLSHEWKKEDDIWTSWKAMSKQKNEIANGIRLENASWRTWAKQKYHLRTVNPEKINWLKDNDVTWLYGPFHTEDEFHLMKASSQPLSPLSNSNNTDYVNYVNDIHSSPTSLVSPALSISSDPCTNSSTSSPQMFTSTSKSKSCLKKKKISEILRPKSCATNTISDKNQYDINITNYYKDIISTTASSIIPTTSMIINNNNCGDGDLGSDCETASTCSTISAPTTPIAGPTKSILLPIERESNQHNHHIRFNDQVEQCIAIDSSDCEEEEEDKDDKENSIDNNNKKIMKKKKDCFTICKIAPTKLKPGYSTSNKNDNSNDSYFNYDYNYEYDCNYDHAFSSTNHNINNNKNDKNNAASSSSTSSTTTSSSSNNTPSKFSWMDDDDDDLDIDDLDIFDFDSSPSSSLSSSSSLLSSYNSTSTIQPIPFCCSQSPPRIISSTSSSKNINDITQSEDQEEEEEEEEDNGLVDKAVNIATSVRVIVQWCSIMVFNR